MESEGKTIHLGAVEGWRARQADACNFVSGDEQRRQNTPARENESTSSLLIQRLP